MIEVLALIPLIAATAPGECPCFESLKGVETVYGYTRLLRTEGDLTVVGFLEFKMGEKPGNFGTRSGSAQMALAKMGHKGALELIQKDLNGNDLRIQIDARRKLMAVGGVRAIRMFAAQLQRSWWPQYYDRGFGVIEGSPPDRASIYLRRLIPELKEQTRSRGMTIGGMTEGELPWWRQWWADHEKDYPDPGYLQVGYSKEELNRFAKLYDAVERSVRDPEAILEIGEYGDASYEVIRYLRGRRDRVVALYAKLPESRSGRSQKASNLRAIQMAIAKLGGEAELAEIAAELQSTESARRLDATAKLEYVGDRRALEILEAFVVESGQGDLRRGAEEALVAARRIIEKLRQEETNATTPAPQPEANGDVSPVQHERPEFKFDEVGSQGQ